MMFFLSFTNLKCFIQELTFKVWLVGGPFKKLDYFESLWGLLFQEIFIYHYYAEGNDLFLLDGPTVYFITMLHLLAYESLAFFVTDFC